MSWREFLHWQAFLRDNHPDQAANKRTAALMAQLTNMSGRQLPDNKRVSAEDFLGQKSEPEQQTIEEQIAFLRGIG